MFRIVIAGMLLSSAPAGTYTFRAPISYSVGLGATVLRSSFADGIATTRSDAAAGTPIKIVLRSASGKTYTTTAKQPAVLTVNGATGVWTLDATF